MICPKCRINVVPLALQDGLRCPQCWLILVAIRKNQTTKSEIERRMALINTAKRFDLFHEYHDMRLLYLRIMVRIRDIHDIDPEVRVGWLDPDSKMYFTKKSLVEVAIVAAGIVAFVVNEIFHIF